MFQALIIEKNNNYGEHFGCFFSFILFSRKNV